VAPWDRPLNCVPEIVYVLPRVTVPGAFAMVGCQAGS